MNLEKRREEKVDLEVADMRKLVDMVAVERNKYENTCCV